VGGEGNEGGEERAQTSGGGWCSRPLSSGASPERRGGCARDAAGRTHQRLCWCAAPKRDISKNGAPGCMACRRCASDKKTNALLRGSIDNSEWMRNGDYVPTRMDSQADAVNLICNTKTSNPESAVGVMTMASRRYHAPHLRPCSRSPCLLWPVHSGCCGGLTSLLHPVPRSLLRRLRATTQ